MSIDVGIRHLSYICIEPAADERFCVSQCDGAYLWGVIDITPDALSATCVHALRRGRGPACGKGASFVVDVPGGGAYCRAHKKSVPADTRVQVIDRNKMDIDDVFESLVRKLDAFFAARASAAARLRRVVIEKQPPTNPRMKAVMSAIHSYFVVRGRVDHANGMNVEDITMIDAKHKLRVYDGPPVACAHLKRAYDRRKFLSKAYLQHYLDTYHAGEPALAAHVGEQGVKRDDLADCYLQAKFYFERVAGREMVQRENNLASFCAIDPARTRKRLTDTRLRRARVLSPLELRLLLATRNITETTYAQSAHSRLIAATCEKHFGGTAVMWDALRTNAVASTVSSTVS